MPTTFSPLQILRSELQSGHAVPATVAEAALARANSNAGRNVYLARDFEDALRQAVALPRLFDTLEKPLLYGVPVSLKDCFDLENFPTSGGSRFYAVKNGLASADSAVAARLRSQGAIVTGKTHLHMLAYGITGENRDYGDCLQPSDAALLTGGSTSGGAASVQEGSALAAIGTDTGGSIRVPAALCGLAGYRASIPLARDRGLWRGCMPLAESFDTLGWIFRDLRDGPLLAEALFDLRVPRAAAIDPLRIASVQDEFMHDCEPTVLEGFALWRNRLANQGASFTPVDTRFWEDAMSIFAPIQAHEAAAFHTEKTGGDFSHFERSIAERLAWGAARSEAELNALRARLAEFNSQMDAIFREHDFLIVPCSPTARLIAGADQSQARAKILRYTSPMSLAGNPVITLPAPGGAGVQLVAAPGADAPLLRFAAVLAEKLMQARE